MKSVVLVTGASSGSGALIARALADVGHTVYASMRDTKGRNAPQAHGSASSFPSTQLNRESGTFAGIAGSCLRLRAT